MAIAVSGKKLKAALRKGLKVSVTVPSAGKLSATAAKKGKTVAKAAKKSVKAGKQSLTLKFTQGRPPLAGAQPQRQADDQGDVRPQGRRREDHHAGRHAQALEALHPSPAPGSGRRRRVHCRRPGDWSNG